MTGLIQRFLREETGATMVEYAIMVAMIAIVVLVAVGFVGGRVNAWLTDSSTKMPPS